MIIGGQTGAHALIIDYHAPFDQGFSSSQCYSLAIRFVCLKKCHLPIKSTSLTKISLAQGYQRGLSPLGLRKEAGGKNMGLYLL